MRLPCRIAKRRASILEDRLRSSLRCDKGIADSVWRTFESSPDVCVGWLRAGSVVAGKEIGLDLSCQRGAILGVSRQRWLLVAIRGRMLLGLLSALLLLLLLLLLLDLICEDGSLSLSLYDEMGLSLKLRCRQDRLLSLQSGKSFAVSLRWLTGLLS